MADESFEKTYCCTCGIQFCVPQFWINKRRETAASFYCPNGHSLSYTESTADRLRKEKVQIEQRLQAQINAETHLRLVAEKALKQEVTKRRKIERRISNGVCPCYNRTFADLAAHMGTKHKDYALPPGQQKRIEGTVQ